jgi:8-oxo-dGTP pyrophosphatase MutT (NUDIX family)
VLILSYPHQEQPHIVFTRRSETVGLHRGQISLPGGRREEGDPTLAATALRETTEELGIATDDVQILGSLPQVYVVVSNFLITPFVGMLPYRPRFVASPAEVAEVIEVPLEVLADPASCREEIWPWRGSERVVEFYAHEAYQIWGATGRVIKEFLASPLLDAVRVELSVSATTVLT